MNAAVRKNHRGPARRRSYALGAVAVAALMATTACGPGSGDAAADGGKPSDRPSATDSTGPTGSPSPSDASAPPKASPSTGKSGGNGGGDGGSETGLCTHQDLSFSATKYDAKGEPVRHLMLVATNTSGRKCDLQGAPEVTLGNAKGPAPVKRETDPGEVLTLAPGGRAYAGLLATGGHMDTYDVTYMKIGLGSPGGEAEPEKPVALPMPVRSFPADDGQRVTYWAGTEGLAMRPVTRS